MGTGSRRKQHRQRVTPGRGAGRVRIIGGQWRGRKLPVADLPGLRPTGDRVRETLFNWIQAEVYGARCADLFAGSGVLGFEAASRGAAKVTLVEKSGAAARALENSREMLGAGQVTVVQGDAIAWLEKQPAHSLDIVFIDPPFDSNLAVTALQALAGHDTLAAGGLAYVETAIQAPVVTCENWVRLREKQMGEVRIQLLQSPA